MIVYYCLTIAAIIAAAIAFHQNVNVTVLLIVPTFLLALTVFQAFYFKTEKVENGFRTNYPSELSRGLTAKEENERNRVVARVLFATTPWFVPFILFFPSPVKCLSALVYFIGFVGGAVWYKSKAGEKQIEQTDDEGRE